MEETTNLATILSDNLFGSIDWSKLGHLFVYDPQDPILFCTSLFLFMFLGFSIIYHLLNNKTEMRLLFVTLFSYYFYYKSSGLYFCLLALVTVIDYNIGRVLNATSTPRKRRKLVVTSVLINLGLLCYFKYTNFLCDVFSPLLTVASDALFEQEMPKFGDFDIILPVGISFFTFQSMSYTIDIYRNKLTPVKTLLDYAFYVSFFPQLVAGPIVRASDFIPQIRKPVFVSKEMFGKALFLIIAGIIKKTIISDYISINYVDRIFAEPTLYSGVEDLLGVYGYTLQIYCDFSGYSDMAIGIALLLGFQFPLNFNSPYKSTNVTEFWARWHISLSSWLRDYLYISLGGNRKGKIRTYVNLTLTMLLGGLWHGANWNFILWGGMHGLALVVHKLWMKFRNRDKHSKSPLPVRIWSTFVTFHFVCLCWIFFRASSIDKAISLIQQIFLDFRGQALPQVITGYWGVFTLMAIGYLSHYIPDNWMQKGENVLIKTPLVLQALVMVIVIWCMIQVKGSDIVPFIYFQF